MREAAGPVSCKMRLQSTCCNMTVVLAVRQFALLPRGSGRQLFKWWCHLCSVIPLFNDMHVQGLDKQKRVSLWSDT